MDTKRRIALSASLIAIALGAGHLVQSNTGGKSGQTAATAAPTAIVPLSAKAEPEAPKPAPAVVATANPRPAPPPAEKSATAPAQPAAPATAKASPAPVPPKPATPAPTLAAADPVTPAKPAAPAPAPQTAETCDAKLTATTMPGAVLSLALVAPCDGGARVVLRHAGLAVTGKLSPAGTLFTTLPAMVPQGEVSVLFPDGTTAAAETKVDMAGIHRFAVQWQADDAFQLQVYENGAAFGAPGHVSAATPVGEGRLAVLGDATVDLPMLAQVYTFPPITTPVDLTVEAAVTDKTCNRELLGEAVESVHGKVVATEITLAMPDCAGVGDFLVLNNLAGGTTLAAAD